jgi:hypothetical protein
VMAGTSRRALDTLRVAVVRRRGRQTGSNGHRPPMGSGREGGARRRRLPASFGRAGARRGLRGALAGQGQEEGAGGGHWLADAGDGLGRRWRRSRTSGRPHVWVFFRARSYRADARAYHYRYMIEA